MNTINTMRVTAYLHDHGLPFGKALAANMTVAYEGDDSVESGEGRATFQVAGGEVTLMYRYWCQFGRELSYQRDYECAVWFKPDDRPGQWVPTHGCRAVAVKD